MTIDVITRKLVEISKETTEDALNSLNIGDNVLAKRSNVIWDILLDSDETAGGSSGV